jgi:hypothetical protein
MKTIIWQVKHFFWRVKNLIDWIPTVWNIRWYDYEQYYLVLRFMLEKSIKEFESSKTQHTSTQQDIQYMRLCIKLIDRITQCYYQERSEEELYKIWGENVMISEGEHFEIRREREKTEEDSKRYAQDFIKSYEYWRDKEDRSRALLFNILKNKLEHWWI